jgi:putative DNA primase/helicase
VIASGDAEPVFFTGNAGALHYRQRGTIEGWQAGIASRATGNRLLVFALALAFVGPVMRALSLEGGGFHFRGTSSSGKTTLATAAGSVWGGGGPLGFASSWRATGNALEGVAYGHSETALILDELALVDPAEAGSAAYALATGQGKARAKQDGGLRRRAEWRVTVLSTGEIGLADHMRSARLAQRTMAGQELRLIDLAADAGAGMGAFEQLHGAPGPAQFADAIKDAALSDFGLAGPLFVKRMIAKGERADTKARELLAAFVAEARRESDSGQIHRAALRFGAVAAAGELAIGLQVVPWPAGTAKAAARWLFDRWAEGFGRTGLMEERQVIIAVRNAIQQNQARFGTVTERLGDEGAGSPSPRAGEARALSTLGYSHAINFEPVYLLHAAGWGEILKGFDTKFAAKALSDAGFLWTDGDNRHKKKVRLGGAQAQPFYVIRASLLEYDEDAAPAAKADYDFGDPLGDDELVPGWDG